VEGEGPEDPTQKRHRKQEMNHEPESARDHFRGRVMGMEYIGEANANASDCVGDTCAARSARDYRGIAHSLPVRTGPSWTLRDRRSRKATGPAPNPRLIVAAAKEPLTSSRGMTVRIGLARS